MNRKRTSDDIGVKSTKKNKKVISLDVKLDVLRRFQAGEKAAHIGRILNLAPTTIRSICNRDATKIIALSEVATDSQIKSTVISRSSLIVKMESLLSIWIEHQTQRSVPPSKMVIQAKAKSIYDDLQRNLPIYSRAINEQFNASGGWFERFKTRANLHNIYLKSELSASTDNTAAKEFCINIFQAVVQEGGYTPKQIFNVDETDLFWKRLPKRTLISKEESALPGFKVSKDRLTLLLGGNANGDCKLTPFLVYHSENPRALKGVDKKTLSVHWRSNKKAWFTGVLFRDWLTNCAIPEFKKYCETENMDFKILVLLDNAPGHPTYLNDLCDNVKFLFLPPNTTSVIQPMNQGVILNFKSYYLRRTFKQLLNGTDDGTTMKDFWKNYSILKAVNNIGESWAEVKHSCMNGVWLKMWPECVTNISEVDDVPLVRAEITKLAQEAKFQGMDYADFNEILNLQEDFDIRTQDLMEMAESIQDNSDRNSSEVPGVKILTTKGLAKAIKLISEGVEIFMNEDPDPDQSAKVAEAVKTSIGCYENIYLQRKQISALENYI